MKLLFSAICRNNSFRVLRAGLKSWTGGVQHDGFRHFPRAGEVDAPYEPTKLLMVQRIKPYKGTPRELKRILTNFKLNGKVGEIAIVKNIPEMNCLLYKIKHLIEIKPIRTPAGVPEAGDLDAGYLEESGEFRVARRVAGHSEKVELTEEFQTRPTRLDADTLIKQARYKWLNPW